MTSTVHVHPPEDLLWDYHRGRLSPGMRLVVRTHVELCPQCRSELKLFDSVGGALLEETEGVAMSDNALDLALARIERPEEPEPAATVKQPAFLEGFDLPESLKTADIPGRYWAAPGGTSCSPDCRYAGRRRKIPPAGREFADVAPGD